MLELDMSTAFDEWTVVSRKNRKFAKPRFSNRILTNQETQDDEIDLKDLDAEKGKIEKARCELRGSMFSQTWLNLMTDVLNHLTDSYSRPIHELVCYGLGSITSNIISRLQYSMLLQFMSHIDVLTNGHIPCYSYDPAFSAGDIAIMKDHGIQLISTNEEGGRKVDQSSEKKLSIFYMIHCDKPLYENLIRQNSDVGYSQLVIIGNSFHAMAERFTEKDLKSDFPYIYNALHHTEIEEIPIPVWKDNDVVFNDTSIHFFKKKLAI